MNAPAPAGDDELRPLDRSVCATADLLDVGSGRGAGIVNEARRFGARNPIGIERNAAKVSRAQAAGLPVFRADFDDLDPAWFPSADVVTFDNVLEHLPDAAAVERALGRAFAIASRLVYVRHPSFEHVDYLASLGVKQYWTDWSAHTARLRVDELVAIAARRGVHGVDVRPVMRALDSADRTILPLDAPPDQHKHAWDERAVYDETVHGPKPVVAFELPVYFAFDVFFYVSDQRPSIHYARDAERELARPSVSWRAARGREAAWRAIDRVRWSRRREGPR